MKNSGGMILVAALAGFVVCGASFAETFRKHPKSFRVGPNATAIVAADLNGDGHPEIITSDRGPLSDPREERPAHDQISYLIATDNLVYEAQPQLRSGFGPYTLVVANIDGLKAPDILVGNFMATRNRDLTLLRNIGSGLFEPVHFSVRDEDLRYMRMLDGDNVPIFTTPGITSLAVADVNQDGYRDVIATGWSSDVLIFFPGAESGYFGEASLTKAPGGPRDVATADFDRDGNVDLVTAMYSSNEIALWKGDGKGAFYEAARFPSRGALPQKIVVADVNGDRKKDLIVSHCHGDDSIVIFYGDGGFRFGMSQEYMLGEDRRKLEYEIRDIAVADFNRDGYADFALACHSSKEVIVLMNESKSRSIPQKFALESYSFSKGNPRAVCVADFNSDNKLDLGVVLWDVNSVSILLGK